MDFNTHKVNMPLHIYKVSRTLWQYYNESKNIINVYSDVCDIFQDLYKEIEIKADLCNQFIMKCNSGKIYKYPNTTEILLSFYIKKIEKPYNLDCPYSFEGILEQLKSKYMDYLQELEDSILKMYKEIIKLKSDYLGAIYNKDSEIEINSVNTVMIPYNDYEEFEKMIDEVETLVTKCSDILESIKYCKNDDFRHRIFNQYFKADLLYICKSFMNSMNYSIH